MHLNKDKVIELLKNRKETYKDISKITGYHEKYLVKLNKSINQGIDIRMHKSTGKHPPNYISQDIKNNIISSYNDKYSSKIDFYNKYIVPNNIKISYSHMSKLIDNKIKRQILVLKYFRINGYKYYVAFDYESNKLLALIKSNNKNTVNWLLLINSIVKSYGVPDCLYDYGIFTHNEDYVNNICKLLDIKRVNNYKIKINKPRKEIIKLAKNNYKEDKIIKLGNITYRKADISSDLFYIRKRVKLIGRNTIQFKNKRYYIESNDIVPSSIVTIYYPYDYSNIIVEVNNKKYSTHILKKIESSMGKSKYY